MRPKPHRLEWPTYRPSLDKLSSFHSCAALSTLAVTDSVDATSLVLHPASFLQHAQLGERGFIAEEILAVPHRGDAERASLTRDACASNELDRIVFQYLGNLGSADCAWKPGRELRR